MREPCAVKVACTVPRGEGSSNGAFLPNIDFLEKQAHEQSRIYP